MSYIMLVCETAITTHYIRAKKLLAILACAHRLYLCECRYISIKMWTSSWLTSHKCCNRI